MISSLELQNYRGFHEYKLGGLARVNLLVGDNNSGKTSVLEAIHLLAQRDSVAILQGISYRRGEMAWLDGGSKTESKRIAPVVSHFFFGHEIGRESSLVINAEPGARRFELRVVSPTQANLSAISSAPPMGFNTSHLIEFRYGSEHDRDVMTFPASKEGLLYYDQEAIFQHMLSLVRKSGVEDDRSLFVPTDPLQRLTLNGWWNDVLTEGQEAEVVEMLRILEPALQNLYFLSGNEQYPFVGNTGGILVDVKGKSRRLPLGSSGEGMYRLLVLALALTQSRGGCLLIDEIDTGLHYSIMGDLWLLIVQAAQRYKVQVFATTHSSDCVRGLAWLCDNYPDLGAEVSLQKIEPRLAESVAHDAEQILIAADLGIEVR